MLTRLKVSGFKNLVDVDVRFGPFTCIAGANGAGKSNLFDAIQFLSALADDSLRKAAESVRSSGERTSDGRDLFHRVGDQYDDEMVFEVEMIVPRYGVDDLGQEIEASHTLLRYKLKLTYSKGAFNDSHSDDFDISGPKVASEELLPITETSELSFISSRDWRKSILYQQSREPLISTHVEDGENVVVMGTQRKLPARRLRKTMLSAAGSGDDPIVHLARQEIRSWRVLRLEPSALRKPDPIAMSFTIGSTGTRIPATLYTLSGRYSNLAEWNREQTYSQVAGRLSELIDDVRDVWLDLDEKRDLITLYVKDWNGTSYPAHALSDGTLRFLALAIIEQNPSEQGVICLEEPENGIPPTRIPAMLRLLQDIATDTDFPVGPDNPLRQVIINTHSPSVVQQVPDDALLFAGLKNGIRDGRRFKYASFSYLSDTWRAKLDPAGIMAKGDLLAYLNPVIREHEQDNGFSEQRVIDRPDLQLYIPGAVVGDE